MKLKEKVYATIKEKIFSFEMKPGEIFFETGISKQIGVSRTPVREAMNRLEQEGLINRLPDRGYSVVDISSSEIEELYELREVLEVFALRSAFEKAKKQDWVRLERRLLSQPIPKEEFSKEDYELFSKEAQRYDQEIARLSGKTTLQQIIHMLADKVNRFRWMNIFYKDRSIQSHNEHLEIVNYLKNGKIEDAVIATQKHIRKSRDNILNLLSRKKDLLYID